MTRTAVIPVAVTALAFAAPAALATPGPADHAPQRHLTVIEHAAKGRTGTPGGKASSASGVVSFHNKLYDARDRSVVGRDAGRCVRNASGDGTADCEWVVFVKGGRIFAEGTVRDAGHSTLDVTGGAGRYRHARGELDLAARRGGKKYVLTFSLTR